VAQSVFLERSHRLPNFAPCCIDGLICADGILHSEPAYQHGAGCQGRCGARCDHVSFSCGPQPAVGVQKRNDFQQVERVSTAHVR